MTSYFYGTLRSITLALQRGGRGEETSITHERRGDGDEELNTVIASERNLCLLQ